MQYIQRRVNNRVSNTQALYNTNHNIHINDNTFDNKSSHEKTIKFIMHTKLYFIMSILSDKRGWLENRSSDLQENLKTSIGYLTNDILIR